MAAEVHVTITGPAEDRTRAGKIGGHVAGHVRWHLARNISQINHKFLRL